MRAPTDLLADALEGGLHDPQERVALAAALREDEDLARQACAQIGTRNLLVLAHQPESAHTQLIDSVRHGIQAGSASGRQRLVRSVHRQLHPGRQRARPSRSWRPVMTVVLLLVLVGFGVLTWRPADPVIGTIVAVETGALHVGQDVAAQDSLAGHFTLDLADGSRLQVSGGHLRLAPRPDRLVVELASGSLDADVQPRAGYPLVVTTPHGEVGVVGTRFRVEVATDQTVVAMQHGHVRLQNDAGALELHEDEVGLLTGGVAPMHIHKHLVLDPRQADTTGTPWQVRADGLAVTDTRMFPDDAAALAGTAARIRVRVRAGVPYRIWVRGTTLATAPTNPEHADAIGIGCAGATCSPQPSAKRLRKALGPWAERHAFINGFGSQPGWSWLGGNGKTGQDDLGEPATMTFAQDGEQDLLIYPLEAPMVIDAIILSTTQMTRP